MSRPRPGAWRDALRDSELDRTAKLVGLVISTYIGSDLVAWPSRETIARGASLGGGCRAVDLAVQRLERAGFLRVARSAGRRAHRYHATLPTSHGDAGFTSHGDATLDPPNVASDDVQRRTDRRPTSHGGARESVESALTRGSAAAPAGASLPEDECSGCGAVRPLHPPDYRSCADCVPKAATG